MSANRRAATLGAVVIVTVVLLGSMMLHAGSTGHDTTTGSGQPNLLGSSIQMTSAADSPTSSQVSTPAHSTSSSAQTDEGSVDELVAEHAAGSVSVSAVNLATGKHVSAGANSGMLEASVSKVALLEILLLERQRAGKLLTDNEDYQLTQMIEHSSNDAANNVFDLAGGHAEVVAEQVPLGLNTKITVYGSGNLWGLTTSSAMQQIILLRNLVDTDSPLNGPSRDYALNLLSNVEADQRWGVPVAADKGSTFYVKNGWLAVDDDNDLWAVNSDGIITVHGQRVLVSVMTQHDAAFDAGIDLCEQLVRAAVKAVA